MAEKENRAKANARSETAAKSAAVKARGGAAVKHGNFRLHSKVLSVLLVLSVVLGLALVLTSCNRAGNQLSEYSAFRITSSENSHNNKTQVGYSCEILGYTDRTKPVDGVHDEGMSAKGYPVYGSTLDLSTEEKTTLIRENRKIVANGTWYDSSSSASGTYDKMDKDGYLYKSDGSKPDEGVPERLYKHTGSVGLYGGNVADNEPAVVKSLTFRPRSYSSYYDVTGLYAPAGEVIKVQLTNADMNATGGITIHIGQALYNGQANNIWEQRGFNRMPVILNTMNINKNTATYDEETDLWTGYVGSFLGGPIYVRDESCTFSVTISGGVNYAHFILGVTTEAEYNYYLQSSAPYFDLEVWDNGVLHSGPKRNAERFGYNDLYKAAVLWEKISLVTTSSSVQGIVFLYDPFVAAGAAVAFPGRRSVNCPESWMADSLNYEGFVTSGSWGNMHEYHHNFQNYGLSTGADGEVTNNGLNLVTYSLFTKISSARQIAGYGGAGLSGWNQYTSAPWALNRVNNGEIGDTNGLAVYATLLHNFGQDAYLKARTNWGANYFNKFAEITHNDMTYYAEQVQAYSNVSPDSLRATNYPLFVPVSSVYQTGRTYSYDGTKREITTMQPYVIPFGQSFKVDLTPYAVNAANQYASGSVVIGKGFKYSIKSVNSDGINGTFVKDSDGIYTFTPNNELYSGKIRVTLEITTEDGAKVWKGDALEDVDLIL
ncbi:MAG: M60 family metallopeptidase [Clostridia bacterium]|nr:M60 family metallopeptidase [Clostridia bacterium]